MSQKNVVLFINSLHAPTFSALRAHEAKTGKSLEAVVIVDRKIQKTIHAINNQQHLYENDAVIVPADFGSVESIRAAIRPYEGHLYAVTSQYENSITEFKKIIPHLPYLQTPTETSLDWSTDKKLMRQAFNAHDTSLSPASMHVQDTSIDTIAAVERDIQYPMIVKPSGLERSLLVSVVNNRTELISTLNRTFKFIRNAYKNRLKRIEPIVLVEELMQGDMFSVDSYVSNDGTCYHAPLVKVVTGRQMGFEDFFAYLQMSPAGISPAEEKQALATAEQACKALGLRSITAHTEMMKTPKGWKIIEVGPRIGGYRHELYTLSHGMNHIVNDIVNRAGEMPYIPAQPKQHAAIFKTYAREEGTLEYIQGLDAIRKLPSYITMKLPFNKGDMLKFAQNDGDAPIEVTLCHPSARQLHADIATLQESIQIHVIPPNDITPLGSHRKKALH